MIMKCTCFLFFLTLALSVTAIPPFLSGKWITPSSRDSVELERGIIAKRIKHHGHIVQQGYNNGTVKLHLSAERDASGPATLLQNDGRHIGQPAGYNDGGNTLFKEDESGANAFNFGSNTGDHGSVVQEGTNKGSVDLAVVKSDALMAKRLNDPKDKYTFPTNNGSIGQQGRNKGEIVVLGKPPEGTIVQQGLNKGELAFTDKRKRALEPIDEYVFKGNNGTIAQQGESVGKVELKVRDESSRGAYAKRQSTSDHFNFSPNKGSVEQKGANINSGKVGETMTRTLYPKASRLNDPKEYKFKPNNGTIIQQGLNKGIIRLHGKPYVGNIPQQGKNEGKITYNGKIVKPRDEPSQFNYAGVDGKTIDQKGTNTGEIKQQEKD